MWNGGLLLPASIRFSRLDAWFSYGNGIQKVDNVIHLINLSPLNSTIGFLNTYPLDRAIRLLNNPGLQAVGGWWGWGKGALPFAI